MADDERRAKKAQQGKNIKTGNVKLRNIMCSRIRFRFVVPLEARTAETRDAKTKKRDEKRFRLIRQFNTMISTIC